MGLNKSTGNMYEFVTHTWNTIKGKCPHDCSYCYMKRWGEQKPVRFDKLEFKTDLGEGNFIFVGSSCDMFADDIPNWWIEYTLNHCKQHPKNKYLLQTKNPGRYKRFEFPDNFILGTTIETNRFFPGIMGDTPLPIDRTLEMQKLVNKKFVTIEPILEFDIWRMQYIINTIDPQWVNIGADSGHNNLPEPSKEKIEELISKIDSKITIKKNMKRYELNKEKS